VRQEDAPANWRLTHASSGKTSRLILAYVEREAGRWGVEAVLAGAGMADREADLLDENSWFSFDEKLALFAAAAEVLHDPRAAEHIGAAAMELSIGLSLKRALRALGSPSLALRNIGRANNKFNRAHDLSLVSLTAGRAVLAYRDISGAGHHRIDCDYTAALLRTIPELFGLPPAQVSHPLCGTRGDDHCEFVVIWTEGPHRDRPTLAGAGAAIVALAAAGIAVHPLLFAAGGVGIAIFATWVVRSRQYMRQRIVALENQIRDQELAASDQLTTLSVLSSELRLDEVLDRITASASNAIGGAGFVLLQAGDGCMVADRCAEIPPSIVRRLEQWAQTHRDSLGRGSIMVDDLARVAELEALATDPQMPLGSACFAPLLSSGELLGVLVAVAPGPTSFLPGDQRSLEIHAGQAAIVLTNARLVEQLEHEAAEDPLTGLANRRVFQSTCRVELDRAARHGTALALVMFDLDHFKAINDTYGHPFGDSVLINVGRSLRSVVRGYDTTARIGGEEFALLLPGADADRAREVADRAREQIAAIELPRGVLSCSAGVALTVGRDALESDLIGEADRALYAAKRQGRARTVLDAPSPSLEVPRRAARSG